MRDGKPVILIVEDDEDMANLNARLLKRHGYETLVAGAAAEARQSVQKKTPDLFVLDIVLPDGDGFSLCEEFRQKTDAPVLFLTGKTETENRIMGLRTGGDYYLTKPYDRDELVAVVQSLLRRAEQTKKKLDEASVVVRGPVTLKITEGKAYVDGKDAELTHKEFALLLLLVQNEEKNLPAGQLYEQVWNMPMNNNTGAIRVHISNLKKKLDEENTDDFAILYEQGKGYVFTTA